MNSGDTNDATATAGRPLVEAFCAQLRQSLLRRTKDGTNLLMRLEGDPTIVRCVDLPEEILNEETMPMRERMAFLMAGWRRVLSFQQLVQRSFHRIPELQDLDPWGRTSVWFGAVAACRYARRFLDQLGIAADGLIDLRPVPDDFEKRFGSCLRDAEGALKIVNDFTLRCVAALQNRAAPGARSDGDDDGEEEVRPTSLRMICDGDAVRVEWLAAITDKEPLWQESLDDFVVALTKDARPRLLSKQVHELQTARRRYAEEGRSLLDAVSPRVAEAVETSLAENCHIGLRLATGCLRDGFPLSLWLYLDPRQEMRGVADVTLSVHRAHEEFILEGPPPRKKLYYFPPSVITARLSVSPDGVGVAHWPTVLVPPGGAPWAHPYSGILGRSSFCAARFLGEKDEPALLPPSEEALGMFPRLADRTDKALENDLCLDGQKYSIANLVARFRKTPGEPDVLGLITGLLDIVRLGLTRGHCLNQSSPRTSINDTIYPVPVKKLPKRLADRVFPYNPNSKRRRWV